MTAQQFISCIVPTRNRAELLPRTLDSVLEQTYPNLEVIVVDGASTDGTDAVLDEYEADSEVVTTIRKDEREGVSAARNEGIEAASGEYVAFLDDDDEWLPEKLERQVDYLTEYSAVCCLSIIRERIGEGTERLRHVGKSDSQLHELGLDDLFLDFSTVYPSGTVMRTDELRAVGGFDESLTRGEFWDLILQVVKAYDPVYVVTDHLVRFDRAHQLGRVSERSEKVDDVFTTFDRHKDDVSPSVLRRRKVQLLYERKFKEERSIPALVRALAADRELYVPRSMIFDVGATVYRRCYRTF
jgi:glycosyltransferase involved in cell wall biosynthesis